MCGHRTRRVDLRPVDGPGFDQPDPAAPNLEGPDDLDGVLLELRRDDHLRKESAGAEGLAESAVGFHDGPGQLDIHRPVDRDDPTERADHVSFIGLAIGDIDILVDGAAAGIEMLDHDGGGSSNSLASSKAALASSRLLKLISVSPAMSLPALTEGSVLRGCL